MHQGKMKALVTYGPHDYRLEEADIPRAEEGEMIIKVEGCGICAGDLKAFKGEASSGEMGRSRHTWKCPR